MTTSADKTDDGKETHHAIDMAKTRVWGPDVVPFNHRRFLHANNSNVEKKGSLLLPSEALGDDTSFCFGRHFATIQILA
ncbi:hypothetical protein DL764_009636 [Monosporascus ibericus]|uniref:Uncharacterized protein n=1 Tax=Monosporascus ibericus TaxID=155417 RepID=A0A4Q4SUF4_9PEZI|nr:hypothetical protein DL764_009636 [Monosporascus ibericus]